ncbi:MAG: hypothetical protein ACREGC_04345, partial [Minisyncoccia bacterium]
MNQQTNLLGSTEPNVIPCGSQPSPNSIPTETQPKSPSTMHTAPEPATRCAHLFQSGRRCRRKPFAAAERFCRRHAKVRENVQPDDLTPELTANPEDLDTFDGLHNFLEDLLILLARNRVSTRRAAVLAYITNQLIRTLTAAHKENGPEETPQIIWDAPRPIR